MKKFYFLLLSLLPSIVFANCEDGIYNVSAYYSPLPGQKSYSTGSYIGDIRLNGSGVNTASGTSTYDVDSLFLAAPSCFKFGTVLDLEGFGQLKVLDRGGSIKGNKLDIWLGFGQDALDEALKFGRQDINVKILGSSNIENPVKLKNQPLNSSDPFVFINDLKFGDKSSVIILFKQFLFDLDLFDSEINDLYNQDLVDSLDKYLIANPTISLNDHSKLLTVNEQEILYTAFTAVPIKTISLDSLLNNDELLIKYKEFLLALGYINKSEFDTVDFSLKLKIFASEYGLETDEALQYLNKIIVEGNFNFFTTPLKLGDSGIEVRILQKLLNELNYLKTEPTGYFGKVTENAVYKLQLKTGIISPDDLNTAGYFGPATRSFLNNLLLKKSLFLLSLDTTISSTDFTGLKKYDSSENVKTLQEILIDKKYLNTPFATDYFGDSTFEALKSFASDNDLNLTSDGLIDSKLNSKLKALLN